jgi:hypothetical protein
VGEFSAPVSFATSAACPSALETAPSIITATCDSITVAWDAPADNGNAIIAYKCGGLM